jgi:hypothetical protein
MNEKRDMDTIKLTRETNPARWFENNEKQKQQRADFMGDRYACKPA